MGCLFFTFNSLINGFLLENRVAEAAGIFNKMIAGDVFTFSVLVDTLCKEGMVVEAEGAVEMIQRDIDPNAVTHTSLMMGLVANTITYNTLVDGFCKVGRIDDAQKLFSEMQACG
ncbi:Tetratricopeptide repeat-like superfamily protein [Prunus dulcis]|uniref:Tetratricopeptide repeat-like superfamily protein n=1 Tax=Prunus dulcis TaxID=3755 RepID=A0A4Y1RZ58_PRUDU|nr:Tetratricopeptide repeat-like superfamily protein [Prunus dulcis]